MLPSFRQLVARTPRRMREHRTRCLPVWLQSSYVAQGITLYTAKLINDLNQGRCPWSLVIGCP